MFIMIINSIIVAVGCSIFDELLNQENKIRLDTKWESLWVMI